MALINTDLLNRFWKNGIIPIKTKLSQLDTTVIAWRSEIDTLSTNVEVLNERVNNGKNIQTITATVNVQPSPNIGSTLVTFEKPFANKPFVFVSPTYSASVTAMYITDITTTGFTIRLQGNSQADTQMQFLVVGN